MIKSSHLIGYLSSLARSSSTYINTHTRTHILNPVTVATDRRQHAGSCELTSEGKRNERTEKMSGFLFSFIL